jgi:hypothetical protein
MKKFVCLVPLPLLITLTLTGCTQPYEEIIVEAEDGSTILEQKVFPKSSIPDVLAEDLRLLADQALGSNFQIVDLNEVSSTKMDFNIEGPGTAREILFDVVCGRMIVENVREVDFWYLYTTFLDSGTVIKATRTFAIGEGECSDLVSGKLKPEQSIVVEGVL